MAATSLLDSIIDVILKNEGGFANVKEDSGGPTNYGVIQSEYSLYLGRPASIDDMKKMPIAHARDIFKKKYYFAPKINLLPEELQPVVTDACVLYGPKRGIIFLQTVLGTNADGVLGPATAAAADQFISVHGIVEVVNYYVEERIEFCKRIVARNPSQKIFLKGWTNRANSFRLKA
jgi:lysozyme family protein